MNMKARYAIVVTVLLALALLVFWHYRRGASSLKPTDFVLNPDTPEGLTVIRPSGFVMPDARGNYAQQFTNSAGETTVYLSGRGVTLPEMISAAYQFSRARIIFPPGMPTNRFDYLVTVPDQQHEKLQAMIRDKWGYTAHPDKQEMDVLALKVVTPGAPDLQPTTNKAPRWRPGRLMDYNVGILVWPTENRLMQPVVNETHLTNAYDFNWNFMVRDRASIDKMLAKLGLGLEPKREELNVLVVEKLP